jgi:HK97 family phage major capsid protein
MSAFTVAQDRAADLGGQIKALTETPEGEPIELDEAGVETLEVLRSELTKNNAVMQRMSEVAGAVAKSNELIGNFPSGDTGTTIVRSKKVTEVGRTQSFGDYASKAARGEIPREEVEELSRAMSHSRAFVDQTTANLPGILPPAWARDIVDFIGQSRPFITALDQKPLPDSGLVINYPRVTVKPLVAKQVGEKTEIASRATVITNNSANVDTYAGGEDMSIQAVERTDPSYLSIVFELYAEEAAVKSDQAAIAAATTAVTQSATFVDAATAAKVLAEAAGLIFRARLGPPDALIVGIGGWEWLSGLTDADGRPLLPHTGLGNPLGSTSAASDMGDFRGLNLVVDPNMTDNVGFLANSRAFTSFLGPVRTLTADVPAKLGYDAAVFQMAAFAVRRPDAMVELGFPA